MMITNINSAYSISLKMVSHQRDFLLLIWFRLLNGHKNIFKKFFYYPEMSISLRHITHLETRIIWPF